MGVEVVVEAAVAALGVDVVAALGVDVVVALDVVVTEDVVGLQLEVSDHVYENLSSPQYLV